MSTKRASAFLIFEKVLKMTNQLVSTIFLARFFDVNEVGNFFYCLAIATLFMSLNTLGLENVVVSKIVKLKEDLYRITKNVFLLRLSAAVTSFFLVNLIGFFYLEDESLLILFFISIYHFALVFSVFDWLLQAKKKSLIYAYALLLAQIFSVAFKVIFFCFDFDILYFGLYLTIEYLIPVFFYFIYFKREPIIRFLKEPFDKEVVFSYFKLSLPLVLTGGVTILYMRLDQLMVGAIEGTEQVAFYTLASRLSEAWYFLGLSIISVYFPVFISLKNKELSKFRIERLGAGLFWFGIALSLATLLTSEFVVDSLYGNEYSNSSVILSILIFIVPFVYIGTISTKMLVDNGLYMAVFYRALIALIINFILNYILISNSGASGAALASLISQVFGTFLLNYLSKETRPVFKSQLKMLSPVTLLKRY